MFVISNDFLSKEKIILYPYIDVIMSVTSHFLFEIAGFLVINIIMIRSHFLFVHKAKELFPFQRQLPPAPVLHEHLSSVNLLQAY